MTFDDIIQEYIKSKELNLNPTPYEIFIKLLERFMALTSDPISLRNNRDDVALVKYCKKKNIQTIKKFIDVALYPFVLEDIMFSDQIQKFTIKEASELKNILIYLSSSNAIRGCPREPLEFKNPGVFLSRHILYTADIQDILTHSITYITENNRESVLAIKKFQSYLSKLEIDTGEKYLEKCLCPFMKFYNISTFRDGKHKPTEV